MGARWPISSPSARPYFPATTSCPASPTSCRCSRSRAPSRTGTKLVTVHDPIRPGEEAPPAGAVTPGEVIAAEGEIEINAGRGKAKIRVLNTGDRPIQVGSHYHFFETNRALEFDRAASFGMHLDIPAGTAVRFEPGESKEVALTGFGGSGELSGLNGLSEGSIRSERRRDAALRRARERGFRGA